jgi:hypothetical protein
MLLRAEFDARFPSYQHHKDQHPHLRLALGEQNPLATDAAYAVLRTSADHAATTAGTTDDATCLLGLDVHTGAVDTIRVPLGSRDDALAALANSAGIVVADGISVSLQTVARIAAVPTHVPLLARLARRDGMREPWAGPVLGFLGGFHDMLSNLLANRGRAQRDETIATAVLDLQRYATWLVGLALPSPADVLATFNSTLPVLDNAAIAELVSAASAADWAYCCDALREWMTQRAHSAAWRLVNTAWSTRLGVIDTIHQRAGAAMEQVATAYLRLRYTTAPHLYAAVLAVDNYLTASARVAYAGLVPEERAIRTRVAPHATRYEAGPTISGASAIVLQAGVWYAARIIERLRGTPVLTEALAASASAALSLDATTLMLFAAMMWRWVYITHVIPAVMPSLRTADRITASLAMFTRPDTPARTPMLANVPNLIETMRDYMRSAWSVRTVDVLATRSAIALVIPYGAEPAMPLSIATSPAPLNEPAPVSDSDDDSDSDEPAAPRKQRMRDDGSARRFARRQQVLLRADRETAAARRAGSSLPVSPWGDYAYAHSGAVPQPRSRPTKSSLAAAAADVVTPPPIPLGAADPAPMPELRPARVFSTVSKPAQIEDHMLGVIQAHAEVLAEAPRQRDADNDVYVRTRHMVALAAYYWNKCQSLRPGVRITKRARDTLLPIVQRGLGVGGSRGRHLRVLRVSPLHPLARQLLELERTNTQSDVVQTLFEPQGVPVLHLSLP